MPFSELQVFVDKAIKNRKYPVNTGHGMRAALKLFEKELNEEEALSLDTFESNLDQIYRTVCQKNGQTMSASSLATYKSRLTKVLEDFKRYGTDPTKLTSWTPQWRTVTRVKKVATLGSASPSESTMAPMSESTANPAFTNGHRVVLMLRPNTKFILEVPSDITTQEAKTMTAILESLVAGSKNYVQPSVPKASDE